ncbi:hypothetical protein V6Z11_A12G247500 [Gossypium hirsutum]
MPPFKAIQFQEKQLNLGNPVDTSKWRNLVALPPQL